MCAMKKNTRSLPNQEVCLVHTYAYKQDHYFVSASCLSFAAGLNGAFILSSVVKHQYTVFVLIADVGCLFPEKIKWMTYLFNLYDTAEQPRVSFALLHVCVQSEWAQVCSAPLCLAPSKSITLTKPVMTTQKIPTWTCFKHVVCQNCTRIPWLMV